MTRILKISRNTCYKYLKFVNFNAYIKENKRAHYLDQYKEILLLFIKKYSLIIINKEFYYEHKGFLSLDHKAGKARVGSGEYSFIEKGEKIYGKYLVWIFIHLNVSYVQLLKNENIASIVLTIRYIFEYLNGVLHII